MMATCEIPPLPLELELELDVDIAEGEVIVLVAVVPPPVGNGVVMNVCAIVDCVNRDSIKT